jgi:hypothetical protein
MSIDVDALNEVLKQADQHQERLASALVTLESRINEIMAGAPLDDGNLFDLEWAVNARVELRQAIEQEYLTEIDQIIRDYQGVADTALAVVSASSDLAKIDQNIIRQLQTLSFKGFEDLGQEFLDAVSKQIYESTLVGVSFADSLNIIKASVSKDLGRYASVALHDGLMGFYSNINTRIALDAGATEWKYFGADDESTREFCDRHVGKTYNKEEIEEIWQGSWAGKKSSNAFADRGGYNCRHHWQAIFEG